MIVIMYACWPDDIQVNHKKGILSIKCFDLAEKKDNKTYINKDYYYELQFNNIGDNQNNVDVDVEEDKEDDDEIPEISNNLDSINQPMISTNSFQK